MYQNEQFVRIIGVKMCALFCLFAGCQVHARFNYCCCTHWFFLEAQHLGAWISKSVWLVYGLCERGLIPGRCRIFSLCPRFETGCWPNHDSCPVISEEERPGLKMAACVWRRVWHSFEWNRPSSETDVSSGVHLPRENTNANCRNRLWLHDLVAAFGRP
jgi:hypothetical protein